MSVRVLSIALGGVYPSGGALSGALQRQLDYARWLEAYHVITEVAPPGGRGAASEVSYGNLTLYPSNTASRLAFLRRAIELGDRIIRRHSIQVITCADPGVLGLAGLILARRHKLPLDVSVMSDIIDNPHFVRERPLKYGIGVHLSKWLLAQADGIRVSTTLEYEKLKRLYGEKVYIARFYVDQEPYGGLDLAATAALREELTEGGRYGRLVLFVGRMAAQKRIDVMLRAAARVAEAEPDTRFVLVGYGPELQSLRRLAAELGLDGRVLFTGAVPFERIPLYFGAADVFAITSHHEGTCMVLLEAALAAKPIVATNFAGAADVLGGVAPDLIQAINDHDGVADALVGLLRDPERRARVGAALRMHVAEAFAPDAMSRERAQAWIRLTQAGQGARGSSEQA